MSFSMPIQCFQSHEDTIWLDGTFNTSYGYNREEEEEVKTTMSFLLSFFSQCDWYGMWHVAGGRGEGGGTNSRKI
jgi:hypothetical protein